MNKKLTTIILICTTGAVDANLIDLTPGGFNWNNAPKVVNDWYATVRPFQTLYPENMFTYTGIGTPELALSWDLSHIATFQYLFVEYLAPDGELFANFYQVPQSGERRFGTTTVTVNGVLPVTFFNAFGRRDVPDTGTTLLLFGFASLGLVALRRKLSR